MYTSYYYSSSSSIIEDLDRKTDTALVVYKASDIDKFKYQVGILAYGNEYQCHYSALVRTKTYSDGSESHIIFPLIYYNYPQEVSSAHIDFEMKDVLEKSKEVKEASLKLYTILKSKLMKKDTDSNNVTYRLTLFNNIHKHP